MKVLFASVSKSILPHPGNNYFSISVMKKSIYIAFIALGLCACNNNEENFNDALESGTPDAPVVYHMSIKASFDDAQTKGVTFDANGKDISTQFESTDKIYVYNKTKDAFARIADDDDHNLSYLQPSSISASGGSCTLEGNMSFYKLNDSDEWEAVTIESGDEYNLYYGMNDLDYHYAYTIIPRFDYTEQDGSASSASACDFAEATGIVMTLSDNTLTVPEGIQFENLQSMFRQRLSFKKDDAYVTPTITKLTVGTKNETLLFYYAPTLEDTNDDRIQAFDYFDIYNPVITSDGDIYLSLAFYYTTECPADEDQLILTATDDEGNVYQCAKNVPVDGFQNSRYYYGSSELVWQYKTVRPIVTRSDDGEPDELIPDGNGWHSFSDDPDPAQITISGNSLGYIFWFDGSAEITLSDNGTATSFKDNNDFIYSFYDLTIELVSDYTIICPNYGTAIWADGSLKFKTTGNEQKLTVTTNDDSYCGIYGWDNYDDGESSTVNDLAADGFTVTRSDRQDNVDGTYTWVYTVTPNP